MSNYKTDIHIWMGNTYAAKVPGITYANASTIHRCVSVEKYIAEENTK